MAAQDYLVLYDLDEPGDVLGMWNWPTSTNIATYETDGYLQVDGTTVAENLDLTKVAAFTVNRPTTVITTMERKCCIVTFNGGLMGDEADDVIERAAGSRDPDPIFMFST